MSSKSPFWNYIFIHAQLEKCIVYLKRVVGNVVKIVKWEKTYQACQNGK